MDEIEKANSVAHQIATAALMQTLYAALMGARTKAEFKQMGRSLEGATVQNLARLATISGSKEADNYVREAASAYVSHFFASIECPPHLP